jgi:hypothetical protein
MSNLSKITVGQLLPPQRIASKKIKCTVNAPPRKIYSVLLVGSNGSGILQQCNPYMPCEIPTDGFDITDVGYVMVNDSDKEIKSIVLADEDAQPTKEYIKGEEPYIFAPAIEPSRDIVKIQEDRFKYEEFKKTIRSETLVSVSLIAGLLLLFGREDYSIGFGVGSAVGFVYLSQLVFQIDYIENKGMSIAMGALRYLTLATALGLLFSRFSYDINREPELIIFGLLGFSMFRLVALTRNYE